MTFIIDKSMSKKEDSVSKPLKSSNTMFATAKSFHKNNRIIVLDQLAAELENILLAKPKKQSLMLCC